MFVCIIGLFALLCGALICLIGKKTQAKAVSVGVGVLAVVLGIAGIAASCVASVPTGHTGVVTTFGRVEPYTPDSGLHYKAPWQEVVKMDNRVQKNTVEMNCFSSDIQEVTMVYTINYQIKKTDAMTIYSTIGQNYYETVIMPSITQSVKVVAARYSAEELVSSRDELAAKIETDLADKLIGYNIEVVSTSIEDMDFTDAFTNAVEEKQVAQQNKLRAQTEAEQQVIEAEAAAKVKKVEAEAAAYEILAKAEAEAEANRKLAESLTNELIQYTYAQNWDGKLPTYYAGDAAQSVPVLNFGE